MAILKQKCSAHAINFSITSNFATNIPKSATESVRCRLSSMSAALVRRVACWDWRLLSAASLAQKPTSVACLRTLHDGSASLGA